MKILSQICALGLLVQSGCLSTISVVNGVDASIPRKTQIDPGSYVIRLRYGDLEPVVSSLRCERYYEAQASTRGNYWAWREVGTESQYQAKKVVVVDEQLGAITFSMPTCDDLKNEQWKGGPLLVVHVGEEPYFYVRSTQGVHTYKPSGRVPESSYIHLRYLLELTYMSEPNQPSEPTAASGRGSP